MFQNLHIIQVNVPFFVQHIAQHGRENLGRNLHIGLQFEHVLAISHLFISNSKFETLKIEKTNSPYNVHGQRVSLQARQAHVEQGAHLVHFFLVGRYSKHAVAHT